MKNVSAIDGLEMEDIHKEDKPELPTAHSPLFRSGKKVRRHRPRKSPVPAPVIFYPLLIGAPFAFYYTYYEWVGVGFTFAITLLALLVLGFHEWSSLFRPSSRRRGGWNRRHFTSVEIGTLGIMFLLGVLILVRYWAF